MWCVYIYSDLHDKVTYIHRFQLASKYYFIIYGAVVVSLSSILCIYIGWFKNSHFIMQFFMII